MRCITLLSSALLSFILAWAPSASGASLGDLSCDGQVTVVDVQLVIFQVLQLPLSPAIDADQDGIPDACTAPEPGVVCDEGTELNDDESACVISEGALDEASAEGFAQVF